MSSLRILDFDIENRPLAYLGSDYTTAEITAIAAAFVDSPSEVSVWLLGRDDPGAMLDGFRAMYDVADIVTGHFIRGHDLPVINGAMLERGRPPLGQKRVQDTKTDLVKRKYISASQENLAGMLGLAAPKVHMSNPMWREANRLTPKGLRLTEARVVADVHQHMALRKRLVELGALGPTSIWSPSE